MSSEVATRTTPSPTRPTGRARRSFIALLVYRAGPRSCTRPERTGRRRDAGITRRPESPGGQHLFLADGQVVQAPGGRAPDAEQVAHHTGRVDADPDRRRGRAGEG